MTTLADINKTLEKQTKVLGAKQTYTSHRVDALTKSFNDFFEMVTGDEGDDLEKSREKSEASRVQDQVRRDTTGGPGKGRFFDFDVGNFLPFLGTILGGLFKRGIPAVIAALLADEIGAKVKDLTGSDLLGNIAEWSTMGGAFGFLFGGVKGGILGAAIGAIFSEGARDKYAEILQKQFGLSAESSETGAMIAAAGLSMAALLLPKILPLLFGPVGLILLAAGGIALAISKYNKDPKFKEKVDQGFADISAYLNELVGKIVDFIADKVKAAKDAVIEAGKSLLNSIPGFASMTTTEEEKNLYREVNPTEAAKIDNVENRMAELVGTHGQTITSEIAQGPAAEQYRELKARRDALVEKRDEFLNTSELNEQGGAGLIRKIQNVADEVRGDAKNPYPDYAFDESAGMEPVNPVYVKEVLDRGSPLERYRSEKAQQLDQMLQDQSRMQQGQMSPIIAPVDQSQTNIGNASTAFVGSGTNSVDTNNPILRRAMEAMVL